MSLTKEMIMHVENQIEHFDNVDLLIYYNTYKQLSKQHPNSYYDFMVKSAFNEILNRGIEDERTQ